MCKERLFTGKIVGIGSKRLLMCKQFDQQHFDHQFIMFETMDNIIVFLVKCSFVGAKCARKMCCSWHVGEMAFDCCFLLSSSLE